MSSLLCKNHVWREKKVGLILYLFNRVKAYLLSFHIFIKEKREFDAINSSYRIRSTYRALCQVLCIDYFILFWQKQYGVGIMSIVQTKNRSSKRPKNLPKISEQRSWVQSKGICLLLILKQCVLLPSPREENNSFPTLFSRNQYCWHFGANLPDFFLDMFINRYLKIAL